MDFSAAAGRSYRLLGVDQQIQDDLLDFLAVDDQHRQLVRVLLDQLDVERLQLVDAKSRCRAGNFVQVGDRALQRRAACEKQQMSDDLGGAVRVHADLLEVPPDIRAG